MSLNSNLMFIHRKYNGWAHGIPDRYHRLMQLVKETAPRRIMEIGVWNGVHSKQMLQTAYEAHRQPVEFFGFDLFEMADEQLIQQEVSKKALSRREIEDLLTASGEGHTIKLFPGNTKQSIAEAIPSLPKMDFVFIDGGHSYETAKSDWENTSKLLHDKSVVVFDDHVNEPAIAQGWGVNQVVDEIDRARYTVELLSPIDWWEKDWGMLKVRLVLVKPRVRA